MRVCGEVRANSLNAGGFLAKCWLLADNRPEPVSQPCDMSTAKHRLARADGRKSIRKVPSREPGSHCISTEFRRVRAGWH